MILQTSLVKLHLPEPEKHGSREDVSFNQFSDNFIKTLDIFTSYQRALAFLRHNLCPRPKISIVQKMTQKQSSEGAL